MQQSKSGSNFHKMLTSELDKLQSGP